MLRLRDSRMSRWRCWSYQPCWLVGGCFAALRQRRCSSGLIIPINERRCQPNRSILSLSSRQRRSSSYVRKILLESESRPKPQPAPLSSSQSHPLGLDQLHSRSPDNMTQNHQSESARACESSDCLLRFRSRCNPHQHPSTT